MNGSFNKCHQMTCLRPCRSYKLEVGKWKIVAKIVDAWEV